MWKPPACGDIKTDYDGATFDDTGEAGIGVVVRLDSGEVFAALSEKIPLPSSIEVLEALAAHRATQFVVELAYSIRFLKGIQSLSIRHSQLTHLLAQVLGILSKTHCLLQVLLEFITSLILGGSVIQLLVP
uniref:RNase H type-1 domain-containing protein n=1 Tax=Quercus lobata TaxID=97700 RepID=A0A7N2LNF6_QUELO